MTPHDFCTYLGSTLIGIGLGPLITNFLYYRFRQKLSVRNAAVETFYHDAFKVTIFGGIMGTWFVIMPHFIQWMDSL